MPTIRVNNEWAGKRAETRPHPLSSRECCRPWIEIIGISALLGNPLWKEHSPGVRVPDNPPNFYRARAGERAGTKRSQSQSRATHQTLFDLWLRISGRSRLILPAFGAAQSVWQTNLAPGIITFAPRRAALRAHRLPRAAHPAFNAI